MVELKGKQLLVATILSLLVMGSLAFTSLPEAYCPLEDKTVRYVHMSDSHKTVTKVLPSQDEGGYSIMDDRCQKGSVIGEWIPIDKENVQFKKCSNIVIAYTDNGKYYCTSDDSKAVCINMELEKTTLGQLE